MKPESLLTKGKRGKGPANLRKTKGKRWFLLQGNTKPGRKKVSLQVNKRQMNPVLLPPARKILRVEKGIDGYMQGGKSL